MRRREYHWSLFHRTEKNQIDHLRTDQVEAIFLAIPAAHKPEWFIWKDGLDEWKPFLDFPQLVLSLRKADDRVFEVPPPPPVAVGEEASPVETLVAPTPGPSSGPIQIVEEDDFDPHTNNDEVVVFSSAEQTRVASRKSIAKKTENRPPLKPLARPAEKNPKASANPIKKNLFGNPIGEESQAGGIVDMTDDSDELSLMRTGVAEDRNNMRFEKQIEIRIFIGDQAFKNTTSNISLKGMQLREDLPKSLPRYFNVEIGKGERVIPVVCSEVKAGSGVRSTRLKIESNEHASALLTLLLSGS